MTTTTLLATLLVAASSVSASSAFVSNHPSAGMATCPSRPAVHTSRPAWRGGVQLNMAGDAQKAAPTVNGEEFESVLREWDQPLVVDAYATWCGPCAQMAPEFEEAARELSGKVRFVKLDAELEPQMAERLGVMGLPTLLFLDKNDDAKAVEEGKAPVAVLKGRVEGALGKQSIKDLCDHHFFGGPMPTELS